MGNDAAEAGAAEKAGNSAHASEFIKLIKRSELGSISNFNRTSLWVRSSAVSAGLNSRMAWSSRGATVCVCSSGPKGNMNPAWLWPIKKETAKNYRGEDGTQIKAMQIMWNVLRENEQVPNVQKSLSDQMVRIAHNFHIFSLRVLLLQNHPSYSNCPQHLTEHTVNMPSENDVLGRSFGWWCMIYYPSQF